MKKTTIKLFGLETGVSQAAKMAIANELLKCKLSYEVFMKRHGKKKLNTYPLLVNLRTAKLNPKRYYMVDLVLLKEGPYYITCYWGKDSTIKLLKELKVPFKCVK